MKRFLGWIFSVLGYGVYTLAVFVILMWFLFPVDSLESWLEAKINRQSETLAWQIGDLRLAWPLSIVALDVTAADMNEQRLIKLDELKVRPDFGNIDQLRNGWPLYYRISTLKGTVFGPAHLDKEMNELETTGEAQGLELAGLEDLWVKLGREGSGRLSGTFNYQGQWYDWLNGDLQADLAVADGSLELLEPVLGLDTLVFKNMTTEISLRDRIITLESGKVDSNYFAADFDGTVTLAGSMAASTLDINGSFEPRPEMLASIEDQQVMQLIKGQLRDGRLRFELTDSLLQPGILFQGATGAIDGIIQRSSRER